MNKPRRFDLYPSDWLASIAGRRLGAAACGVMAVAILIAYDDGRPSIPEVELVDRLASIMGDDPRTIRAALDKLVKAAKLVRHDGEIEPNKVRVEIERAEKRIRDAAESGAKGGRPRKEVKDLEKGSGSGDEKLAAKQPSSQATKQPSSQAAAAPEAPPAAPRDASADRQLEDRILDAAKIDPARWPGNFGMVATWRNQGATDADILAGIEAVAARKTYRPPASLAYFTNAIADARRARLEAAAAGRDPPRTEASAKAMIEQRAAEYRKAKDAAKARGLKPGDRGFPPSDDYGIAWDTNAAGWVLIDGWAPRHASDGAAA